MFYSCIFIPDDFCFQKSSETSKRCNILLRIKTLKIISLEFFSLAELDKLQIKTKIIDVLSVSVKF